MEIFEKVKTLWKQQEQIKEDQTQIKDKIENTLRSCVEYGEIIIQKIELMEDEIRIYIDTDRFNGMPLEKILQFLDKMGSSRICDYQNSTVWWCRLSNSNLFNLRQKQNTTRMR